MHPKTGKVCVPIQPEAAWDFNPDTVPTVQELVQQLQEVPLDTVAKVGRWGRGGGGAAAALRRWPQQVAAS